MAQDIKALTQQFLAQRQALLAFITGLVRDPHVAEDLFQEVWLRLADAAQNAEPIQDVPKWCRGVAKNLILHHWRTKQRSSVRTDSLILDQVAQAFDESPAAPQRQEERTAALSMCLLQLQPHAREVLRMKYEDGMKVEEIAVKQQKTVSSLMMLLCRVRQLLAHCVEKKLAAGDA